MKIMTIFGTRPEGIKMAPLVKKMKADKELTCIVVNTAQHRDQLDQVLETFSIEPEYDLNIMKEKQTPESLTADILTKLSAILEKEKPDLVLVHGDTTTTFAGAYAAFLKQIPIGHVEAGLRTYERYSPFPEELNRQLVGRLATYHFAATERNRQNLLKENVADKDIVVTGNTVIDALYQISNQNIPFSSELAPIFNNGLKTILMTTHRKENMDQLKSVYEAINQIINEHPDVQVVFPVHKNPSVREKVSTYLHTNERVHLIEPLAYADFVNAMKHSYLIITDSGGIQEEAPSLGIPVLVARDTTERQEGVEAGTLKLVGTNNHRIYEETKQLLTNQVLYDLTSQIQNPYGDGQTCERIIQFIKQSQKKA